MNGRHLLFPRSLVTEKRGRGRPPKEGTLSNAQRQAAFRARRKQSGVPVTVTKIIPPAADGYDDLVIENDRLRAELGEALEKLRAARLDFADVSALLRRPVGQKWSYRQITALAERQIRHHVRRAVAEDDLSARNLRLGYAWGVQLFWCDMTCGSQADGDSERLLSLLGASLDDEKPSV